MNYYGINKKVKAETTDWVGPKARIEQRRLDAEREIWLDEVVCVTTHVPNICGITGRPDEYMLEHIFTQYKGVGLDCRIDSMTNPYQTSLDLRGKRRDIIAEFGEGSYGKA